MLKRALTAVLPAETGTLKVCPGSALRWQSVFSSQFRGLEVKGGSPPCLAGYFWVTLPMVNILIIEEAVLSDSQTRIPGVLSSSLCFDVLLLLYSSLCKVSPLEFHPKTAEFSSFWFRLQVTL